MNKKFTFIHYSLLALSLGCSIVFYREISFFVATLAILFELFKPTLFINSLNSKGGTRLLFAVLVIVLLAFNLLAISSSFVNVYNKQSSRKMLNTGYKNHTDRVNTLKTGLVNTQNELNNYPTLDKFLEKSPEWEDKTQLTTNWANGKKDITTRLSSIENDLKSETNKNIDKYKIIEVNAGYNAVFKTMSKHIGIETRDLVLIIYLMFAIMLEVLIFYSKTLSVKEFKSYKPSLDEKIKQYAEMKIENEINNILNNIYQNGVITNQENVKVEIEEPKQKQIEEKKIVESCTSDEFTVDEILEGVEFKEVEAIEEKSNDLQDDKNSEIEEEKETRENLKEVQEIKFIEDPIYIDDYKEYFECCKQNLKGEFTIGISKIANSLGIPNWKAQKIFKKLKDKEYLKVEGMKTKVVKSEFDINDFEEVLKDDNY